MKFLDKIDVYLDRKLNQRDKNLINFLANINTSNWLEFYEKNKNTISTCDFTFHSKNNKEGGIIEEMIFCPKEKNIVLYLEEYGELNMYEWINGVKDQEKISKYTNIIINKLDSTMKHRINNIKTYKIIEKLQKLFS